MGISIHALREEGDCGLRLNIGSLFDFYPRPPRGGRPNTPGVEKIDAKFLSTPSARRATLPSTVAMPWELFLSTPSARRATSGGTLFCCFLAISIHALREEGDCRMSAALRSSVRFLSTPSARRATASPEHHRRSGADFYPRPPRGGRPIGKYVWTDGTQDFYPRPPRGGRRPAGSPAWCPAGFLSTPSARRATRNCILLVRAPIFLSTPSARRATAVAVSRQLLTEHFYPRPPRGGRLHLDFIRKSLFSISIHALREEGDRTTAKEWPTEAGISIHALREEGDLPQFRLLLLFCDFYPRPPRGGRP